MDHRRCSIEAETLGELFDEGEVVLAGLSLAYRFLQDAKTEDESESLFRSVVAALERASQWVKEAEDGIRRIIGPNAARMFAAHQNIMPNRTPPSVIPGIVRPRWDDIVCRMGWIALRLEHLEGGRK
jgi:hypothetical protein